MTAKIHVTAAPADSQPPVTFPALLEVSDIPQAQPRRKPIDAHWIRWLGELESIYELRLTREVRPGPKRARPKRVLSLDSIDIDILIAALERRGYKVTKP